MFFVDKNAVFVRGSGRFEMAAEVSSQHAEKAVLNWIYEQGRIR